MAENPQNIPSYPVNVAQAPVHPKASLQASIQNKTANERKTTFQVEAPVTRRSPHRPGLEDFPHPVPRFRPFLPGRQPIKRHPDWRITLLPCMSSDIMVGCPRVLGAPGSDQANQLTLIEKRLNTNHFQNEYRRFCPRKTRYRQVQVPEVQILWKAHEFCGRWHYPRSGF